MIKTALIVLGIVTVSLAAGVVFTLYAIRRAFHNGFY